MREFRDNLKKKEQVHDNFEKSIKLDTKVRAKQVVAYLTNFKVTSLKDRVSDTEVSGLLCFFIDEEGECFKSQLKFQPYFYVGFRDQYEEEVKIYIDNKIPKVQSVELVDKVDLEELNHLSGKQKKYLKLSFNTIGDLMNARKIMKKILDKPVKNAASKQEQYYPTLTETNEAVALDMTEIITSIRQYDIPFHSRVCIDLGLRAGKWFQMDIDDGLIHNLKPRDDILSRPDLRVLAYDIETSKDPLKFPDAQKDCVIMISLMFDGQAYLIVNLGFCGQAVQQFEYKPKKEFECHATVYNEPSEKALLLRFFRLIRQYKPAVVTSYNGDRFDFPFVQTRSVKNDLVMEQECGICCQQKGQFYGRYISHLDCFYWVDRDSFLPQGSHGLKAVTRQKLNYEPIEVDPEQMVKLAKQDTKTLAQYSISDAVATFYLYMKHIHDFIFALCTILPMTPDQVLRKGSGTLCENLLMTEAFSRNIIFPNKKLEQFLRVVDGRILDTETYTGGKVECLRTGVYRADIQTEFHMSPQAIQQDLIDKIDMVLQHSLQSIEKTRESVSNYQQVRARIVERLQKLRDVPHASKHMEYPLIYHVDVASMYPNIILTNRLQPVAIVNDTICGSCMWNNENYDCKRELKWEWKGQFFPLNEAQMLGIQEILEDEMNKKTPEQRAEFRHNGQYEKELRKQIRQFSQKTYKKVHVSKTQIKTDTVCMLENSFYVDTVKAFRDRRYDFKAKVKMHKVIANKEKKAGNFKEEKEASEMMAFYDSLQLAHKIILNSYYGYVMRKGARWYSMEMAAMVTHIGGNIIGDCKDFIEKRFGKPLQLDTDGIWLLLPKGFPETETFKFTSNGESSFSYPCMLLNKFIFDKYKNPQYYRLKNEKTLEYQVATEMSIQFEIDGPYRAMFIPSAKQKQKTSQIDIHQHNTQLLKKRYVVYDFNGEIHEFKGFEIKRRGQLQLIKTLQDEIFGQYLKGSNLKECYDACATTGFKWLNILLKRGEGLTEEKLLSYIEESKVLSKDIEQYGAQKGVAVTSARRLSEFLGPSMIKGKGICCYYVICAKPVGRPVTERAIPTSIFSAEEPIKRHFIHKWTGELYEQGYVHLKNILDWEYYIDRLETIMQKMICIPAVTQGLENPLAMVKLPEWLSKKHYQQSQYRQQRMETFFKVIPKQNHVQLQKSSKKETQILTQMIPVKKPQFKVELQHKTRKINQFSIRTEFSQWLRAQKDIWTKTIEYGQLNNFSSIWHILQIVPQKTPGSFMLWYYSNGRINNCSLVLERKYYVKSQHGIKKAPRNQGLAVECSVDEATFLKQSQYYQSILSNKTYQTKLPPQLSFMINKGAVCKVRSQKHTYEFDDFTEQFSEEYLGGIETNFMTHLFLIQMSILDNKQSWLIVNPRLKEYVMIFSGKSARNQNLQKQARILISDQEAKFQNHSFQTVQQAAKFIDTYINEYKDISKSAFLVAVHSDLKIQTLCALGIKSLYLEVPVLRLPERSIHFDNITILDWQLKSMKAILELSDILIEPILKLLGHARYAHMPICNLSEANNSLDFSTNIIFGRMLRTGNHLLWWNDYNQDIVSTFESLSYTGKVLNEGLYTSYCVELDMVNLALVSIAISDDLTADKGVGIQVNKKPSKVTVQAGSLDQVSTVQVAFGYLKEMTKAWIKDAHHGMSEADDLAANFPRWIMTRKNSLYDPVIHRRVKNAMKKVAYMMMLKLKDLGVKIVYSDFQRIIVNTKKRTFNEALNNTKYLVTKLHQEQKSYKDINLRPIMVWNLLMFKDSYNYAGYEITSKDVAQNYVERWEISKCFCPKIAESFQRIMEHYLSSLSQIIRELTSTSHIDYVKFIRNFENDVLERQKNFIVTKFKKDIMDVIAYLYRDYQNYRQMKNQEGLKESEDLEDQESQKASLSGSEDQEEQSQNSFIDNDGQQSGMYQKTQNRFGNRRAKTDRWGDRHQIDKLVSNVFNQIKENHIMDELEEVKRACIEFLENMENTTISFPEPIKPVYPEFEIPCQHCFKINEMSGVCSCGKKLQNPEYIQAPIWKMMNQIGRDLYCSLCNRIMEDNLKKNCPCGGKWCFKQHPMQWVQYANREGQQWEFINEIFEFTGLV